MAQLKAHEFDNFISKSGLSYHLFLVYGPDRGLVSERSKEIAKKTSVDLNDAFALTRLETSDITSEPGRLADEVNAIGLFGGDRLIWIKNASNDKKLVDAIKTIGDEIPPSVTIIVEAGDLKKGSSLRKTCEAGKNTLAIPCYSDDGRALQNLIDKELSASGLRIGSEARQLLTSYLGGDRLASRGEIQKLALYCHGQEQISAQDVIDAIGDASSLSIDDVVDAAFTGKINELDQGLEKVVASKTSLFLVLRSCLMQLQQLDLMRFEIENNRKNASQVMNELGRFIHFKRKPAIQHALNKWTCQKLSSEMNRVSKSILDCRQNIAMETSITRQALIRICLLSR